MYDLLYDRRIEKDLRRIPKATRRLILSKVEKLTAKPRSHQVEKLTGFNGYRLRVGNYRILFTIDDTGKRITIYRIIHRREAYRSL